MDTEKKLFFALSDNTDGDRGTMTLDGAFAWIKADTEKASQEDLEVEYTLIPVWLTDEEYDALPEMDI